MLKGLVVRFMCLLAPGMGKRSAWFRHRRSFALEPSESASYVQFKTVKDSRGNRDSGEKSSDLTVLEFRRFGDQGRARSPSRDTPDSETGAEDTESNSDGEEASLAGSSGSSDSSEAGRGKKKRTGPKEQKAQKLTELSYESPGKRSGAGKPRSRMLGHQSRDKRSSGKKDQRHERDPGDDADPPETLDDKKEDSSNSKDREKRKNAKVAGGKGGAAKRQPQNKSELITSETTHKAPDAES